MAITPKNKGAVDAPNTLTPDAAGSVAVPNTLTPESAGSVAVPNSLTPETAGTVAVPNSLTPESSGSVAVPNSLTAESTGTVAVPNSLTAESTGTVAVPNSLTAETAGAVAVPNSLTAQSAVTFPRTLTPTVSMNFADGLYEQAGQSIAESDLLTYSRASSATFIDKYVTPTGKEAFFLNTDYVGSVTNLLPYSEDFTDSNWLKTGVSVSLENIESPSGSVGVNKISGDGTSAIHSVSRTSHTSIGHTYSVYLKSGTSRYAFLTSHSSSSPVSRGVIIDLIAGSLTSIGAGIPAKIFPSGNGWFRVSMGEGTTTSTIFTIGITDSPSSASSSTDEYIYAWGAQRNAGDKPLPYVKTTATSASQTFSESLRIGYDAATGENLGVLIEGGRTNLCLYSEQLDNASWTKTNSAISTNEIMAPDLTNSADKLEAGSTASVAPIALQLVTVSAAALYTISVFVKRSEASFFQIAFTGGAVANNPRVNFDLSTGVLGSQDADIDAASITLVGGDWFRVSATITTALTSLAPRFALIKSSTDTNLQANSWTAGEGLYIWGVQVEQGSTASSYIPTTTGPASRLADQLSIPVAGNVPNGDMTIHANIDKTGNANSSRYIYNVSSSSGSIGAYSNDASDRSILFSHGSTTLGIVGSGALDSLSFSISLDSSTSTCTRYLNGVESSPESPVGVFAVPNQAGILSIGQTTVNSAQLYGHIKHLKIYDEALTAAEVAQL